MLAQPDIGSHELKPDTRAHEPSSLIFRIGIGGMALLFLAIIIFGNMLFKGPGILDAISAYYYSPMRNFFIGSLSVLGTLLICYRYQRVDKIAGIVAGLCVIGLAIFPREPSVQDLLAVCPGSPGQTGTTQEIWAGRAHWAFSIGFLLTIVFMVLYLFTLSEQNRTLIQRQEHKNWFWTIVYTVFRPFIPSLIQRQEHKNWFWTIVYTVFRPVMRSDQKTLPLPRRKLWRNRAYLVCGGIMIVFLVLCLIDQVFYSSNLQLESISPVFWCELIPLLAFSVAWFVKGVGIWQDKKAAKVSLTPEVRIT